MEENKAGKTTRHDLHPSELTRREVFTAGVVAVVAGLARALRYRPSPARATGIPSPSATTSTQPTGQASSARTMAPH